MRGLFFHLPLEEVLCMICPKLWKCELGDDGIIKFEEIPPETLVLWDNVRLFDLTVLLSSAYLSSFFLHFLILFYEYFISVLLLLIILTAYMCGQDSQLVKRNMIFFEIVVRNFF